MNLFQTNDSLVMVINDHSLNLTIYNMDKYYTILFYDYFVNLLLKTNIRSKKN